MKRYNDISESQINAYIDNELHDNDRAHVMDAINSDTDVAQMVNDTRKDMDLLRLAYNHPPRPSAKLPGAKKSIWVVSRTAFAASILLMVGTLSGYLLSNYSTSTNSPSFTAVNDFTAAEHTNDKIMIHVSRMDDKKIVKALDKVEEIMDNSIKKKQAIDLVLIANESGLDLLKQGSPYADRVHALSSKYKSVKFIACSIAMEVSKLKDGKDVQLLPEAEKVPAALTAILDRLKGGWLYIKS